MIENVCSTRHVQLIEPTFKTIFKIILYYSSKNSETRIQLTLCEQKSSTGRSVGHFVSIDQNGGREVQARSTKNFFFLKIYFVQIFSVILLS